MTSAFMETLRRDIRLRGYSMRTEKTYIYWIRSFIYFIDKRHPSEVGAVEVKAFLTHLAVDRHVAANTQKVALNALVFLHHNFFQIQLGDLGFTLAIKQRVLPAVLSVYEVNRIIERIKELINYSSSYSTAAIWEFRNAGDCESKMVTLSACKLRLEKVRVIRIFKHYLARESFPRWRPQSRRQQNCWRAITRRVSALRCLLHWTENTPMLFDQHSGHLFFPSLGYATTPLPALYADTICTHRS